MSEHAVMPDPQHPRLIGQLSAIASDHGLADLASHLSWLMNWVGEELAEFETELAGFPTGGPAN